MRFDRRTCVQGVCTEDLVRSVPCEREVCVVYSDWVIGSCSATCGSGVRIDRRTCLQGTCTEDILRSVPCEKEDCVIYSDWVIGACSVTCDSGVRVDRRSCIQGACSEDLIRSSPCQRSVCVVYGEWEIGACSESCGSGIQVDRRKCLQGTCTEDLLRTVSCEREACVVYGEWTIGTCSVKCGSGVRVDKRACLQGTCTEDLVRSVPCDGEVCVVYSEWTIGVCSATCGSGMRVDRRTCVQGVCTEDLVRSIPCELEVCVEYGEWIIGVCSVTCGSGARVDRRVCMQGTCNEDLIRSVPCEVLDCQIYSEWRIGSCSVTCGRGIRVDRRTCVQGQCVEDLVRTTSCILTECRREILCDLPDLGANMVKPFITSFVAGDYWNLRCMYGYNLSGNTKITCGANGKFSEVDAVCTPIPVMPTICEIPVIPPYAVRVNDQQSYKIGDVMELACRSGYTMDDSSTNTSVCQPDGTFAEIRLICNMVTCVAPLLPVGALAFDKETYMFEETIKVQCTTGYNPIGNLIITCQANGTFTDLVGYCNLIECSSLPKIPENAEVVNNRNIYFFNDKLEISCFDGYNLVGTGTSICGADGTFTPLDSSCKPGKCLAPAAPLNANELEYSSYDIGDVATFTCKNGFIASGFSQVTCGSNGKFTLPELTCTEIRCDVPSVPENGVPFKIVSFGYGDSVSFICKPGYQNVGDDEAVCVEKDSFKYLEPFCSPVQCVPPNPPANGKEQPLSFYEFGDMITFQCIEGYLPVGDLTSLCGTDGTFKYSSISCEPVKCSMPFIPPFAMQIGSQTTFKFGDVLEVSCKEEYIKDDKSFTRTVCKADGTFNEFLIVCNKDETSGEPELVTCKDYDMPTNSVAAAKSVYNVGEILEVKCQDGYILLQNEQLVCGQNGKFNNVFVICLPGGFGTTVRTTTTTEAPTTTTTEFVIPVVPKKCVVEDLPPNAVQLKKIEYDVAEVIALECKPNYLLVGINLAICQVDGRFSSFDFECRQVVDQVTTTATPTTTVQQRVITCSTPDLPLNSIGILENEFNVGQSIVIKCQVGFELIGTKTRTCLETGLFSISNALCAPVICVLSGSLKNGKILPVGQQLWDVNSSATFKCDDGYIIQGADSIKCQADGGFSDRVPVCVRINSYCTSPPKIDKGSVEPVQALYQVYDFINVVCDEGFTLIGEATLSCNVDGNFGSSLPKCIITSGSCDAVYIDGGFSISEKTRFNVGEIVLFECFPGYKIKGSGTSVCQDDGSLSEIPICVLDESGSALCDPTSPSNGEVLPGIYGVGSIISYKCNDGYRMVGLNESICLMGGLIIPGTPDCIANEETYNKAAFTCTPDQPKNGYIIPQGQNVFSVLSPFEYACNPGYRLSSELKTGLCAIDGSIVGNTPTCILE